MSLNWKDHVTYICSKIAKQCFALKRLNQITSSHVSKAFYHSSFESVLRYGIICCGKVSEANKILILQENAIRYMFGLKFRETCKPVLIKENVLTFPCIYILESLKFVKNNISNLNFQNNMMNIIQGMVTIYNMVCIEWNYIKQIHIMLGLYYTISYQMGFKQCSYKKFNKKVKDILLINAFYSVKEFMMYLGVIYFNLRIHVWADIQFNNLI